MPFFIGYITWAEKGKDLCFVFFLLFITEA